MRYALQYLCVITQQKFERQTEIGIGSRILDADYGGFDSMNLKNCKMN